MFALFMLGPLSLFVLLIGIASIQLFLKTQRHDLIDFPFIRTTAITIAIAIFMLYQFGLNQHNRSGDYANVSILFFGIVGWHLPFLLAGMFCHLWFSSYRAISFGCTIASIWWVFYIRSLTHWN